MNQTFKEQLFVYSRKWGTKKDATDYLEEILPLLHLDQNTNLS